MKRFRRHILTRNQAISALVLIVLLVAARLFLAKFAHNDDLVVEETVLESNSVTPTPVQPVPFDPNTADSLTLLHNGLKPWQIRSMMKYRAKHGRYRKPDDFRKLYGLTDSAFLALKPYIRIDSTEWCSRRDSIQALRHERDSLRHLTDSLRRDSLRATYHPHEKRDTTIELNSADTASLQYIRGIGKYSAIQIIKYRQQLGGYVSPEQIREIQGLSADRLDSVIAHLTANPDSVHPLPVNYASVERLQRHPYLSFAQAKAIYTLRRNRFNLTSIDDLRGLPELTDEDLKRLAQYLSFEK